MTGIHVLAKPTGAVCNLRCDYCFYLEKENLFPEKEDFRLTVTAATVRPIQLSFNDIPDADGLKRAIDDAVPFSLYLDDVHGSPEHRKHLTYYFAEQIRQELSSQNRGHV